MTDASHWLKFLEVEGIIIARTRVAGDWGVSIQQYDATFFHFLTEGQAFVSSSEVEPIEIAPGDVVLISQGCAHQVQRTPASPTVSLPEFIGHHSGRFSEGDGASAMICGSFGVDRHMVLPAIKSLPPILHLSARQFGPDSPIASTLADLRREVETGGLLGSVIIRHLLSTLFVYVLREWSERAPAQSNSWFSAMQSSHVARALTRIHEKPGDNWTLERLADEAGLSRSAFAKQFRESVGEPPYAYLTRWRMGIAGQLLAESAMSIAEVAARVGYATESSFTRAFKQARGVSPSKARDQHQQKN